MTESPNKNPNVSTRMENLSPEKRALLEKLMKAKAGDSGSSAGEKAKTPTQEPIAVIGMGCRFPGRADSPSKLWQLLMEKFDASCELPNGRWSEANPELMTGEFERVKRGGFLQEKLDEFEPEFFSISPIEAKSMDPQQRVLMETAWEAFEDAGQTMESLRHSNTGVFVAAHTFNSEYFWWQMSGRSTLNMYTSTGGAHSIFANRISYWLDLRGPSMVLDTACSSSLVALQVACQSLALGDCNMALAGGVNILNGPEASAALCGLNMLAPDGRCKTFDAGGDGFARSEGAGLIVLKRLKDAERDGDPIRAVIRSTAVNQDGATNGITAPNGLSQQDVIRIALDRAGIETNAMGYIETHGTGTVLGDPIEVEALKEVFGGRSKDAKPVVLGAIKSNIGHLETAAGIAGVIKVVLSMEHGVIPANIHFRQLNPHISLDRTPFKIPVEATPWDVDPAQRFAGISSYGFGGTNAHTIVQGYVKSPQREKTKGAVLLPLTARTEAALRGLAGKWQTYLQSAAGREADLGDSCLTMGAYRTHFNWRAAITADNADELITELGKLAAGDTAVPVHHIEEGSATGNAVALPDGRPCSREALGLIGQGWMKGGTVEWKSLWPAARIINGLPTTAWQRKSYWIKSQFKAIESEPKTSQPDVFIGHRIESPMVDCHAFSKGISTTEPALLNDHRLFGVAVFPATGMLETAFQAIRASEGVERPIVRDFVIHEALMLGEGQESQLHSTLKSMGDGWKFLLHSRSGRANWKLVAEATLARSGTSGGELPRMLGKPVETSMERFTGEQVYDSFEKRGVEFGTQFRHIRELTWVDDTIVAHIEAVGLQEDRSYLVHPALLDACLQGIDSGLDLSNGGSGTQGAFLPVTIDQFKLHQTLPTQLQAEIRFEDAVKPSAMQLTANISIFDTTGTCVAEIKGLRMRRADQAKLMSLSRRPVSEWTYQLDWIPQPLSGTAAKSESKRGWIIVDGHNEFGGTLKARLESRGDSVILVEPGNQLQLKHAMTDQGDAGRCWELINCIDTGDKGGSDVCGMLTDSLRTVVEQTQGRGIPTWFITKGAVAVDSEPVEATAAAVWGLGQVVGLEQPELKLIRVDLDANSSVERDIEALSAEIDVARNASMIEGQVAYRNGQRSVARLRPFTSSAEIQADHVAGADAFVMRPSDDGVLDNLTLQPVERRKPGRSEVEIRVRTAGINFRDVLNSLKMMEGMEVPLGAECCGEVTAVGEGVEHLKTGDIAMAFAPGAMRSHITVPAAYAVRKPDSLNPAEAASMPVVFLTVLYAFQNLAQLKPRQRVLIHSAAGGVGQAAVQIAQMMGAEIIATAGSPEKRALLSGQGVTHVFDSRSMEFVDGIEKTIGSQCVDVVLNSLTGDFIPGSMKLLRSGGLFVELGKREILESSAVAGIRGDIRYEYFDLSQVAEQDPSILASLFTELLRRIDSGELRPPQTKVYPLARARDAFKFMAQARHIGKLVLQFTAPKFEIDPAGTYLITGGLGAIGLATARWLAANGASHLALMGRSGLTDSNKDAVDAIRKQGIHVEILQADVADRNSLAGALEKLRAGQRPLRGIFHSAGVLDDGIILSQNAERYARVMAPKIAGAQNLHQFTLSDPLDVFVMYSSVAATLGWGGQGGYAAANTAMDAIAQTRRTMGLPAQTLNWGPWASEGMAAGGTSRTSQSWSEAGFDLIELESGAEALGWLLSRHESQLVPVRMRWQDYAKRYPEAAGRTLLSELVKPARTESTVIESAAKSTEPNLIESLIKLPPGERHERLMNAIEQQARIVLEFEADQPIGRTQPLHDLGLDSLLTVELRNRLGTATGQPLPASILFDYPTIKALADYLMKNVDGLKSADNASPVKQGQVPQAESQPDAEWIDDISDEEAEKLLLQELEELGSDV